MSLARLQKAFHARATWMSSDSTAWGNNPSRPSWSRSARLKAVPLLNWGSASSWRPRRLVARGADVGKGVALNGPSAAGMPERTPVTAAGADLQADPDRTTPLLLPPAAGRLPGRLHGVVRLIEHGVRLSLGINEPVHPLDR